MALSEEQIKSVKEWIEEGLGIGDIQIHLQKKYSLHLTYMETRFALDDANLSPKAVIEAPKTQDKLSNQLDSTVVASKDNKMVNKGGVSVNVDPVTRPGALVNGSVTFSDGQKASWQLDNMGRISLKADVPGYRPNSEDLMQFQKEIQNQLEGL